MGHRAAITATGRYLPPRVVPNSWFRDSLGLETDDAWIVERTGIRERRFADPGSGETTSWMGAEAARRCLERRGLGPQDIDGIILATVTPDQPIPSASCMLQQHLGAHRAWANDMVAACSGFLYALAQATAFVRAGMARRVLVVGAETMSSVLNWGDRSTCVLFGDGAGAFLVEDAEPGLGAEVEDVVLGADGAGAPLLAMPAGGSRLPATAETVAAKLHTVHQDGKQVFRHAVTRIGEVVDELLLRNGLRREDVDLFVPHQANARIIEAAARRLGLHDAKVVVTLDNWANTTSATIPSSYDLAQEDGRVRRGQRVVFTAFGAGFTWGAALIRP
jgi:3-oxoacyl-[acyl-carrier-protein] synthase-3